MLGSSLDQYVATSPQAVYFGVQGFSKGSRQGSWLFKGLSKCYEGAQEGLRGISESFAGLSMGFAWVFRWIYQNSRVAKMFRK